MIKALVAALFAMAGLGVLMTLKGFILGEPSGIRCPASDYECNYQSYLSDLERVPADYSRARAVAIDTPEAQWRNLAAAAELPDRQSIGMLHVLIAYPADVRVRICRDDLAMGRLISRGEEVRTEEDYRAYQRLLARVQCELGDVPGQSGVDAMID